MVKKRDGRDLELSKRLQQAFGERLRDARDAKGSMQKTLGTQMGLTRTSISNIECGRQRVFLDQVFHAAYLLEVPVSQLLPDVGDIFPARLIRSPTDDPLTDKGAEAASRIVESLMTKANRSESPQ